MSRESEVIRSEIAVIESEIQNLKSKKQALVIELSEIISGVKIGERLDINGKRYEVVNFMSSDNGIGWPRVVAVKHNGQLTTMARHCYYWKDWRAGKRDTPF